MKKNYLTLLVIIAFMGFNAFGQNAVVNGDFENWTAGTADNWLADGGAIMITQNTTNTQNGSSSCEVMWTSQDNQYLTSDPFTVNPGIQINASMWVFDNEIAGRARLCILYEGADNYYGDYSSDMETWQQLTYSDLVPNGATSAQFQIRFYDISGDWDGDATVIVDNVVFENDATVNPEPTNYPTSFAAEPVGTTILTTWTDATGEQIPLAYLLIGNNDGSGFTPPVDGTPVTNDLNWDDGTITVNVLFGAQEYAVPVDPNTEYHFTIYPYTNTGSSIDYKTDGTPPAVMTTSGNSTIVSEETFDTDLGSWTPFSIIGDQVWVWDNFGVPPGCAKMNGYEGGPVQNEDWLISPELLLGSSYTFVNFSFDHARNYASNEGLYVLVSTDYDGSSDPSTNGTWTDITSMYTFPDPGSWDFNPAGDADITMYTGPNTYIAFKYTSTNTDASTWEVDNALVYGVLEVGLFENQAEKISMYPNPATDNLNLNFNQDGNLMIHNLTGQVVHKQDVNSGRTIIQLDQLTEGFYMVQFVGVDQSVQSGKLIIK